MIIYTVHSVCAGLDVPVSGHTPAGNCFYVIGLLYVNKCKKTKFIKTVIGDVVAHLKPPKITVSSARHAPTQQTPAAHTHPKTSHTTQLKTSHITLGLKIFQSTNHFSAARWTSSLITTHSARNLSFIFDEHLTFSDQISALSKSCYYHIRELR